MLIVAAGSLGLFPCYYSLSQETSEHHMGKTTGLLGALAWLVPSPMQKEFGRLVDETHSFGTHGPLGAGMVVQQGLADRVHFRTVGLSKAVASR